MERFQLHELITAVQGEFLLGDPHAPVTRVSIDSRSLRRGDYYFALPGKNFDGHDFLKEVVERGAAGLIVSRRDIDIGTPFPAMPAVVRVPDTFRALGDLAAAYRRKWDIPVAGVTGSNGKTTTKEMLAAILSLKGPALRNAGNFNNQIGVPLTLFNLDASHAFAVIEMGASWPGEISRLREIAAPRVAIVTNIGSAHLENFVTREGVFAEKRMIFEDLPEGGCAVVNADDPFLSAVTRIPGREIITFGMDKPAAVSAGDIALWPGMPAFTLRIEGQEVRVTLPVHGRFNISNALAAAAAAWKLGCGIDLIRQGLETFSAPGMRMETHRLISGAVIVNDAYNANPSSMRESVQGLVQSFPDRDKIVVLADMLELGESAEAEHRALGEFIATQPLSRVILFGPLMAHARAALEKSGTQAAYFTDRDELESEALRSIPSGGAALFKGSRGMQLDKAVERLLSQER